MLLSKIELTAMLLFVAWTTKSDQVAFLIRAVIAQVDDMVNIKRYSPGATQFARVLVSFAHRIGNSIPV